MYRIKTASRRVERELDKVPPDTFERVAAAIKLLAETPRPPGVKKISDNTFRIRVGRYRVIYVVDDTAQEVIITRIARRSETTYRGL
jgi:mRNA interferase RelE/StbE